ncbi:hypothetical protein [Nocardia sp. alder85J]|uniref:hypothetical protein n=1 Tax=Nocardia sp. alder85J TaxID=2862949 RepID=UPI001CD6344A|nr:hypothetical protein [Nocardia sp. alder85J]MCX4097756.1 hypothetical protein [Nocardia sp. alder85J]
MRANTIACAVAAAALAVGGMLIEAPAAHAAKACGFEFYPYSRPTVLDRFQIRGDGRAECDAPPQEHHLTLALQYLRAGRWETSVSRTYDQIPNPSADYTITGNCYAGTWRLAMGVTGTMDGNPFVFSDYSNPVDIGPDRCPAQ